MTRTSHSARLTGVLLAAALSASCGSSTPTAPTPPPVDPPVITCPASQTLTSPLATPIPVVYGTATVAGGKSPVSTTCTPASGATFPLGSTTVNCTATDAQQRSSSCSLTVTVSQPPRIQLTKFVAFGDSITAGENGQNAVTTSLSGSLTFLQSVILFGSEYPTVLRNELRARYTMQADSLLVVNAGNPGESAGTSATLSRFNTVIPSYQAVLLMEGSNDLYNAYSGGSSLTDAAINNLRTMVRTAKNAGVRPYLATVPPMNPTACTPMCRGFAASLVPTFDDRIRTLATSEGVTLVDVYRAFNGDLTLLSSDGLHPNAAGYQLIADTFFDALKSTLEQSSTLRAPGGIGTVPFSGF